MPNHKSLSRRTFVKSAALTMPVVAGLNSLLAANSAGAAQPAATEMPPATPNTKTLRIGLIGCGGRGTGAAVQALTADPNVILVSMGDVFADRLSSALAGIKEELGEQGAARVQVPAERQFSGCAF